MQGEAGAIGVAARCLRGHRRPLAMPLSARRRVPFPSSEVCPEGAVRDGRPREAPGLPLSPRWAAPARLRRSGAGITLGLALGGAALLGACSRSEPAPEPVRAVRTVVVGGAGHGGDALRRDFAAEIRARSEVPLGFRVGGQLRSRPVAVGDAVRAGQLLAELDPADLRLGQQAAQAALDGARTAQRQAESDLERTRGLRQQGFISAAELERRESAWRAAQAQTAQAEAQLAVQGRQTGHSRLQAEAAGLVTATLAEPGTVLAAGVPVLRLALDGPRDVVFQVPEDQIASWRALRGRTDVLSVRLWSEPQRALPAVVREVAAAADPLSRTFQVKADAGTDAALRPGASAQVRLQLPLPDGGLRLPPSALFEQGGKTRVWVVDPAALTLRAQSVEIGGASEREVRIAAGLQPGQRVVVAGTHVLAEGQKVRLYQEPPAAAAAAASTTPLPR